MSINFHDYPTELYTAAQVRELDHVAIEEFQMPGFDLMQRAARFSFHALLKAFPQTKNIEVLCGAGNNAGDGYIVAALAHKKGINTTVLALSPPEKLKGDAKRAYDYCCDAGLTPRPIPENYQPGQLSKDQSTPTGTIIVDALLGTGLNTEVKGTFAEVIKKCNESKHPVFAIDIPSGLSANTGQALGIAMRATATATFIGMKVGQLTGRGRHYCGQLYFDDLKVPKGAYSKVPCALSRLDITTLQTHIPTREIDTHKGQCGRVLLIGGNKGYGGAILLAAQATARMGAGLISVATRTEHIPALLTQQPEVMVKSVENSAQLAPLLRHADIIVVGPGLGKDAWAQQMLSQALAGDKPCILDADALNLVVNNPDWLPANKSKLIYTPHPGEAARMLDCSTSDIQKDRCHAIKKLQQKWGGTFVLKGSGSLILHAASESKTEEAMDLCPYGNAGMASGGMGDVLSGFLGGLLAQGFEPGFAVNLAVCLHARAADILALKQGQRGLLASDLIPIARALLNNLKS